MAYTKKEHEEYLNSLGMDQGYTLKWFEEFHPNWLKTPRMRMLAVWGMLGTLMRECDPIMFKVNMQERQYEFKASKVR